MANQSYHLDLDLDYFRVHFGLLQTGRYEISYFILINKILHIFSSDRQSRVNKNRDIEIYNI